MSGATSNGEPRRGTRGRRCLVAALVAVPLLAGACGGGSKSPSVAGLGTTPTSSGSASSASAGGVFPIGSSMSTDVGTGAAGVKFTSCMRSHGLPSYPDPDGHGTITITISTSLDPSSPRFRAALASCEGLLPPGGTLSPARQQQLKTRLLAFAACMRSHGFPNYPDPKFGPGGMVSQGFGPRNGIDPSSPLFQAAQKACRNGG